MSDELDLTTAVVAAYVQNNLIRLDALLSLIASTAAAFRALGDRYDVVNNVTDFAIYSGPMLTAFVVAFLTTRRRR